MALGSARATAGNRYLRRHAVRPVRLSGSVVDEETVSDVCASTVVSLVYFILGAIFVVVNESRTGATVGEFEATSATGATFFEVGPAFGIAGPFVSDAPFSTPTKRLPTGPVWVGRIEIVPVRVPLTTWYWTR
ncbi:hypothetical protein [Halomicrobium zhouii]|uniref:hypothetical protein n=1 Tax=Halomicrobium zhouii TaxID=767519 RepID=UPI000B1E3312|nr:hypothetical protein [Halomicrobium zhouii]